MTKCASICDSSAPAGRIKTDCDQQVGRCDGACDGACEVKRASRCDGTCSGLCDGPVKGTCGGRCKGTCDGRSVYGACPGICTGTCEKGASTGECKGTCTGSCKLGAPGICDGLCSGTCSVALTDAKCAGELKTPEVSGECRARCELAALNQTECSKPQVGMVLSGAAPRDREVAEAMKVAVDRSYPALLKILFEAGEKGPDRVLNARALIESTRKGFREMARSGGSTTASASEAQLAKCFGDAFEKAESHAESAKTGLEQAQAVRDETTK
jgi:hypothetical protein